MLIAVLTLLAALAGGTVTGVVKDASGAVVAGASVIARTADGERWAVSGPDGRFTIESASGDVTLVVLAPGFAKQQQTGSDTASVTVVLEPAGLREDVTVTASRTAQRLGDVPASVNVLRSEDIRNSPAVVADDVLRQIPSFSLFRRSSSLSSHPTSQGVSLRGIGPSGVSRTLVLFDGIPFNDPFGGWVYWTRVPLEDAERIEVIDGSSSSLYGNYAMGGVISINTMRAQRRTIEFKPQYGSRNSPKLDLFGSDVWGKISLTADGSFFKTDGFPIVIASERGAVDNNANVDFQNVNLKAEFSPASNFNARMRVGHFRENRDNGKASTIDGTEEVNITRWTAVTGGIRAVLRDQSDLQANIYSDVETFRSNFLAVPAATPLRSLGRMTLNQRVPTTGVGGMAQWSKPLGGGRQLFQAGLDWHWVTGDSNEDGLDAVRGQTVTLQRVSGGSQRSFGAYVQDVIQPTASFTATLSARIDHWSSYDAHNLETNLPAGTPTATNFPSLPGRDDTVVSPRLAAIYHVNDQLSVWGDIGSGFRAPTLNELYRQFRVGTVLTLANNALAPERLLGGEFGVNLAPAKDLTLRFTFYANQVTNPVASITIATTPAQVTQQRQNMGKTQVNGFQTDADYRLGKYFRLAGGYVFTSAKVVEFVANPLLVDRYLPQVPKDRGSVRFTYSDPRVLTATFGVFGMGRQFDDDLNARLVPGELLAGLPGYVTTDLTLSRSLTRNFDVYFGAQNLFDEEYIVGTLPTTIGSPRLMNFGVRVRFSGR